MACRLVGAKPLSEPMLEYCYLDSLSTNFSQILIKIHPISFKKMHVKLSSAKWQPFCLGFNALSCSNICQIWMWSLTLVVLRLEYYSKRTKSIPWLLMPWLLALPGHEQPWLWNCKINRSLLTMSKYWNHLHRLTIQKWQKMQIYFYTSACKGLTGKLYDGNLGR